MTEKKKCAHPYPGEDSAHMRLATLDRKPHGCAPKLRGTLSEMRRTGKCRAALPLEHGAVKFSQLRSERQQ
ncbi:MAG TPA: hypothetical protein VF573_24200 [Paraburkholderia sp.]|uniref:hypothetical protein n=1 Tax=Paraburkholderia sp. TaxID=1926495 RepID=UPI002ED38537